MPIIKRICFTGHRPQLLGGFKNNPIHEHVKAKLKTVIWTLYKKYGTRVFITGMALGVDQWAAEIVIELRKETGDKNIKLVAAIPHQGHGSNWPEESQKKYEKILEQCDKVVMVTDAPYSRNLMHIRDI